MDDAYIGYITKLTPKEKKKTHWWRTVIGDAFRKERKKS
jgi:hypothetical protein